MAVASADRLPQHHDDVGDDGIGVSEDVVLDGSQKKHLSNARRVTYSSHSVHFQFTFSSNLPLVSSHNFFAVMFMFICRAGRVDLSDIDIQASVDEDEVRMAIRMRITVIHLQSLVFLLLRWMLIYSQMDLMLQLVEMVAGKIERCHSQLPAAKMRNDTRSKNPLLVLCVLMASALHIECMYPATRRTDIAIAHL